MTNDRCSEQRVSSRVLQGSEHVCNIECMPDITFLHFQPLPPCHSNSVQYPMNYDHMTLMLSRPHITSCSVQPASPHAPSASPDSRSSATGIAQGQGRWRLDARSGCGDAFWIAVGVGRERIVVGQNSHFSWVFFNNWLNAFVAVESVQGRDRETVNDDREQYEPVDNGTHSLGQMIFFIGHGLASFWEEMAGMLDIEHSSNT
jgi:hypothetical protein